MQETEVASPQQPMNNDSTTITCLSDCIYAQNPEKTCMLKNVTFNMSEDGAFECGQYQPAQQEVPEEQVAQPQAEPAQPVGLDKANQQS